MATTRRILSIVLIAIGTFINEANAVAGGEGAAPGEFSFAVQIILNDTNDERFICGGSIISERHILTAAHCLSNTTMYVLSGVRNSFVDDAVVTRVTRIIRHPFANDNRWGDDIGILVLEKDLELGKRQNAIPLATEAPSNDVFAWFAGWGGTNSDKTIQRKIIRKIPVRLSDSPKCDRLRERRTWLCAQVEKSFTCSGDSGSGLVRGGTIIGISVRSWCNATNYDIYTSVFEYRNWINLIMIRDYYNLL